MSCQSQCQKVPECLGDIVYDILLIVSLCRPFLEVEVLKGQSRPFRSDMAGILVGRVDHPHMIICIVIDRYHNHHYLHIN